MTAKTIPFWDAFVKKYDRTPVYTASTAYDSVHIYAEAVKRAGTTETNAVVKALEQTDYVSTSGGRKDVSFERLHESPLQQ